MSSPFCVQRGLATLGLKVVLSKKPKRMDEEQFQKFLVQLKAQLEKKVDQWLQVQLEKEMEERVRALNILKSEQTGAQLVGDVVPAPGDGVVDGDQMFVHRVSEALRRHKGCVIVVMKRVKRNRAKQWKYD